jgi:HEAT repeat protein
MGLFGPTPEKIEAWAAKGNVKKLLESVASTDAIIRELSVAALASVGSAEVLGYCRENAKSMDDTIRWDVTRILGLIGTPEALEILATVQEKKLKIKPKSQ